jgi:hypothetical protein
MAEPIRCWHCGKNIETVDAYCRHCGKGQGNAVPFRYSHGGIILLTLLLGPVALPFILKSPRIGARIRTVYVALNVTITLLMIGSIFSIYNYINTQVRETMKIIEQTGFNGR